ncbi:MAG: phosphodiester glycosidase family protein [Oscillospiraceae bacterium]|nr:phosphodiester glycosidase family protein [Oscillospiraceae bacterium]
MRKQTRILAALLAILLLFPAHALATGIEPAALAPVAGSQIVSGSLQYGHLVTYPERGRQSAHYLLFAPGQDVRPIVSAGGQVFGRNNLSTIISRAQSAGHNVLGGVNSDFFSFTTGIPEGLYISNGRLRSSHLGRGAVMFRADGSAFLGTPYLTFTLTNQAGQQVTTSFFNKLRWSGAPALMDEHFSGTTQTTTAGREVIFRITGGQMSIGQTVNLEVTNILNSTGAINIPAGHMVLSADRSGPAAAQLDRFSVGDRVTLRVNTTQPSAAEAVWGSGGGDILVSGGNLTSGWDAGVGGTHPRTALGIRPDGGVILYTVDGRAPGHSAGKTLTELAQALIALGATEVINLDGGGSTTFSYRLPGTNAVAVQNRVSEGSLRTVATAILLTSTHGQDGHPAHIQFPTNYTRVLGGSLVTPGDLPTPASMTDRGYFPLSTAGLTFQSVTGPGALGLPNGTAFRTWATDARGLLTTTATNGATGRLRMELVSRPEQIAVRMGGSGDLTTITLTSGDMVQLRYYAMSGGAALLASSDMFTATATGTAGSLDAQNQFTASGDPGSQSTLAVTAGGVSQTMSIIIAAAFPDVVGHWSEQYVIDMRNAGVITGVPTGQGTMFQPTRTITRAEFSAMLTRLLGLDADAYHLAGDEFADHAAIPNWARRYAATMHHYGYIQGRASDDGVRFDAISNITRAEVFTVLGRLMDTDAPDYVLHRFHDHADIPHWARAMTARLVAAGMIEGIGDNRIAPNRTISRAESAAMLARLDLSEIRGGEPETEHAAFAYSEYLEDTTPYPEDTASSVDDDDTEPPPLPEPNLAAEPEEGVLEPELEDILED